MFFLFFYIHMEILQNWEKEKKIYNSKLFSLSSFFARKLFLFQLFDG